MAAVSPDALRRSPPRIPLATLVLVGAVAAFVSIDHGPFRSHWPDILLALPIALVANTVLAIVALMIRAVALSGAISGAIIGTTILASTGWPGWSMLACSFAMTVTATRWGRATKNRLGIAEPRQGRRAAGNVVANTGMGALLAIVAVSRPGDAAWIAAMAAALAAAASDTVASEVGKAVHGRTWLLPTFKSVAPGTTGAVSLAGTIAAAAAGAVFGCVAVVSGLATSMLQVGAIAFAAVLACLLEGLLAVVTEERGVFDNDGVNFVMSATGAAVAAGVMRLLA